MTTCERSDVVFVVDSSGSIYRQNWPLILDFMRRLVEDFQIGPDNTRVGVTLFGTVLRSRGDHFRSKSGQQRPSRSLIRSETSFIEQHQFLGDLVSAVSSLGFHRMNLNNRKITRTKFVRKSLPTR